MIGLHWKEGLEFVSYREECVSLIGLNVLFTLRRLLYPRDTVQLLNKSMTKLWLLSMSVPLTFLFCQ
jgi:hypothetical protein